MKKEGLIIYLLLAISLLSGCAATPKQMSALDSKDKKIAIFFDGTANDETSDTNVKKLHSIISLQDRKDLSTFYIEGVGANNKVVGMATGWGIGDRVKKAYSFLAKEYHPGDEVYIIGFSRGAYSARILASLLYYAGLPNIKNDTFDNSINQIYDAFKGENEGRRSRINEVLSDNGVQATSPAQVKALVLWDTVEALGWPDYEENVNLPNYRYGDQLCNVEKAFHAVSIDDDRARIFTPILLTRPHLLEDCEELKSSLKTDEQKMSHLDNIVEEVWFAGAHADVGGGYLDSELNGVSLNWMIRQLAYTGLLPNNARVREAPNGVSHDPEHGFPWSMLYKKQHRNLWNYLITTPDKSIRRLKVHDSVFSRLTTCNQDNCGHKDNEYQWEKMWGQSCFKKTEFGYQVLEPDLTKCRIQIVH